MVIIKYEIGTFSVPIRKILNNKTNFLKEEHNLKINKQIQTPQN